MKHCNIILISLLLILSIGCKKAKESFTELDTLIELNAVRQSTPIEDFAGYMGMSTKDGRFWDNVFPDVKGISDSLEDVKIYYTWLNNIQALFQAYKAGMVERKDFEFYCQAWGSDTTNCISNYVKTFVIIATGVSKTGQAYYLFDSDNDFDLADEIPFETSKGTEHFYGNTNKEFQPHKVIYEKIIDGQIEQDSTWIAFFENENGMWLQFCEKATAKFQFDSINYKIEVRPSISYRYKESTTFKVSSAANKKSKDFNVGEYLKLGNSYYQLDCSSDGLKIFLTKETKALTNGSTQVGMPPVGFTARTYSGDFIDFPSDYKGKFVLLDFWSTGCAPCVQEIRDYYIDIYKKYGGEQFEIIGIADNLPHELDNFIEKYQVQWTIIPDKGKKAIQKKYHIFQYPTLYLINPEGKIIAKGEELRSGKFVSILDENIKTNQ
jgi:peroxiredoxin